MLKTTAISYSYEESNPMGFPDLQCEQGQKLLILGESGCGKTTLLHLLGGLLRPKSGSIEIAGKDIVKMPAAKLDHFRGQQIGVIFQRTHFIHSLSVEDNLLLAQSLAGRKADKARVSEVLAKLNLGHKLKSKPNNLSQGEQQRVAIARAVINKPAVILADEPTSALDDKNCNEVLKLLEESAAEVNASLLIVTHDNRLKEHFENRLQL